MIIKAKPVKTKYGVKRVLEYSATDKGRIEDYKKVSIYHNLSSTTNLKEIQREFISNYETFARKREKGNVALHTMIAINPIDRDKMNLEIIDKLISHYLQTAYPKALAFGVHHSSENHWHTHLTISANEYMSAKSTRLSKERLKAIHIEMISYMKSQFPQMTIGVNEKTWGKKLQNEREYYQAKRHPDKPLSKDKLSEAITDLFRSAETSNQFYEMLADAGYNTYNYKDRVQGIYFGEENHKMRFSRLGIDHDQIAELDTQYADRLEELDAIREDKERDEEKELSSEPEYVSDYDTDIER